MSMPVFTYIYLYINSTWKYTLYLNIYIRYFIGSETILNTHNLHITICIYFNPHVLIENKNKQKIIKPPKTM